MGSTQWLPIQVSQLELGLPLRYSIYSENGEQLASAGVEFSQSLKLYWENLGITKVCVQLGDSTDNEELLQPYDPVLLKRLEENLELSAELVFEMAARMNDKRVFTSMEFKEVTAQLLEDIRKDSAAALLTLFKSNQNKKSEHDDQLADRSAQLSLLSLIIAHEVGLPEPDCYITSIASLLHDISLMGFNFDLSLDEQQEMYRLHPLRSASIVDSVVGFSPKVAMAVAQVHENSGVDGFPRGLNPSRIMPIAKIINLADTYITLTASTQPPMLPPARRFHPSDAIGYVMYHAALGRFEVNTVRALIRATSLYPIGSTVELADESTAVVFRSTRIAPSKPIVRLDSTQGLLDLRYSNLSIRGPWRADTQYEVLRKSQLNQVFWG